MVKQHILSPTSGDEDATRLSDFVEQWPKTGQRDDLPRVKSSQGVCSACRHPWFACMAFDVHKDAVEAAQVSDEKTGDESVGMGWIRRRSVYPSHAVSRSKKKRSTAAASNEIYPLRT